MIFLILILKVKLIYKTEQADCNLIITPNISDTVPVIATATGGPIAGAVALVSGQIFADQINSLANRYYKVTGSFDKPIIKEIKHKRVKNDK